jgi:hypothetical protein
METTPSKQVLAAVVAAAAVAPLLHQPAFAHATVTAAAPAGGLCDGVRSPVGCGHLLHPEQEPTEAGGQGPLDTRMPVGAQELAFTSYAPRAIVSAQPLGSALLLLESGGAQ